MLAVLSTLIVFILYKIQYVVIVVIVIIIVVVVVYIERISEIDLNNKTQLDCIQEDVSVFQMINVAYRYCIHQYQQQYHNILIQQQ